MPLLGLSNEILLQILGQSDILRPSDFCNVARTCKRLSPLTEPLLYREIRDSPDEIWVPRGWKLSSRLAYIIKKFNDNPGRAVWVRSAAFAFDPYRAEWSAAIVDLLSKCTSIHTLSLRYGSIYGKYYDRSARSQENLNFEYFLDRLSVENLSSLTLDDCRLTIKDVARAISLPNLTHLRINRYDTMISDVLNLSPEATYSPTKLKKLEFRFCGIPAGPYVEPLLMNHPGLEDFTWIVDFGVAILSLGHERAIQPAFLSIMSTVTACYLTVIEPVGLVPWGCRITFDFSHFKVLKVLKVHDRWLFGPPSLDKKHYDRCLLPSTLPQSIEDLTILFEPQSRALFDGPPDVLDYRWILALAAQKSINQVRLAKVLIIELVQFKAVPNIDALSHGLEWKYPDEVLDIFHKASIKLKVILRVPV